MKKLIVILAVLGLLAAGCSKKIPQTTNRDSVQMDAPKVVGMAG